jgi:hypothetical protein
MQKDPEQKNISDDLDQGLDNAANQVESGAHAKDLFDKGINQLAQPSASDLSRDNVAQYQPQGTPENTAGTPEDAVSQSAAQNAGQAASEKGAEAIAGEAVAGAGAEATGAAAAAAAGEAAGSAATSAAASASTAAAGATVGSVAPGVGTAIGAIIGSVVKPLAKTIIVILLTLALLMTFVICSLPNILFESMASAIKNFIDDTGDRFVLMLSGEDDWMNYEASPEGMLDAVIDTTKDKHRNIMREIEKLIENKNWDKPLTYEHLYDTSKDGKGVYDAAYILAAYSNAVPQEEQTTLDLQRDLLDMKLFAYTWEEQTVTFSVPTRWPAYKSTLITFEDENGIWQSAEVYARISDETINTEGQFRPVYNEITITDYSTTTPTEKTYYMRTGKTQEVILDVETETYGAIIITPNYKEELNRMYGFDSNEIVGTGRYGAPLTKGDICREQAINLLLIAGYDAQYELINSAAFNFYGYQTQDPLTEEQAQELLDGLTNATKNQKYLIYIALSGVGRIPYYWGGRTEPGWDEQWGNVWPPSENPSGPDVYYGLDCSGFVEWVYKTAYAETATENPMKNYSTLEMISLYTNNPSYTLVKSTELQPGDVCVDAGHTGIFLHYDETGAPVFIHEAGGRVGCVISTRDKAFTYFIRFTENTKANLPWLFDARFGCTLAATADQLKQYDLNAIGMDAATFEFCAQVVEAEGNGTESMYYITQVIKNRRSSPLYPNTIMDILRAPLAFWSITYNRETDTYSVKDGNAKAVEASDASRGLVMYVFAPDEKKEAFRITFLGSDLSLPYYETLPENVTYYQRDEFLDAPGYEDYKILRQLYYSRYKPGS